MVLAAGTLIAAAPAAAATRYAEPDGNGPAGSCPQSNPCDIKTAVEDSSVQDGDVVVVLPGTYLLGADGLNIGAITVRGQADAARPRIVTSNFVSLYAGTLRRMKITSSSGFYGLYLDGGGTAERVIVDSVADAACGALTGTIRDSVCWDHGNQFGAAVSVNISGGGPFTLVLRNVTAVGSATNANGIDAVAGSSTNVSIDALSTIASGGSGGYGVRAVANSGGVAAVTLDHSNYPTEQEGGAGTESVTDPGTGTNQTAAPVFVDGAGGDFHQFLGSPTINAGALDNFSGSLDIDDEPRTMGSGPDIGADEFNPTPPETTITKHPQTPTTHRNAKFAFRSDAAAASFECKLDDAAYEPCDSPKAYQALDLGKHAFKVRATDEFGKTDPTPAHFAWKIVAG